MRVTEPLDTGLDPDTDDPEPMRTDHDVRSWWFWPVLLYARAVAFGALAIRKVIDTSTKADVQ